MRRAHLASLLIVLAASLVARARIFHLPHREGDERIYAALLAQVRTGRGYTLQGHPILSQDWMVAEQYDTPLFYHPPGGLAWFALFTSMFGEHGWDVAELAAFVVFYLATLALARDALPSQPPAAAWTVAVLTGFTPIVAHVSMHRWLDGLQVAAVALSSWLLVRALRDGGARTAAAAGGALVAALLVKQNALVAAPGLLACAWVCADNASIRVKLRAVAIAGGVALLCVAPWLGAELRAFGTIFPAWAGRPSARLVAENPFVHHVTAVRTPWVYLRLLPQTTWTLFPALVTLAIVRPSGRGARLAAALIGWIALVVAANVALGAAGYSKLLRYVVLIAPAAIVLAGLAAAQLTSVAASAPRGIGRRVVYTLAFILAAGVLLEPAHGLQTTRLYPDKAWIRPLFGEPR